MFGLTERRDHRTPALFNPADEAVLSHADLFRRVSARAEHLSAQAGGRKALVVVAFTADIESVTTYLAALAAGMAVMPQPPELAEDKLAILIGLYQPEIICRPALPEGIGYDPFGDGLWRRRDRENAAPLHTDLALLLSTSGSTGSPKTVRLSRRAVEANARQIVAALAIDADERAPTSLPLSYSYGLSVLNSHLAAGAAVILTPEGLTSAAPWRAMAEHGATSFAGIPASYDLLRRLDLEALAPPSLKTLTQAGGALSPATLQHLRSFVAGRGGRLFVMYGQTEATARMAVLPPDELARHPGAAGRAVPDGCLAVVGPNGAVVAQGVEGRILYHGPNVMMGYGESRADLGLGDLMGGRLDTGDLGRLDRDGMLWITGRDKRIAKIDGLRINLDEVEALAGHFGPAAVSDGGEALVVTLAGVPLPAPDQRRAFAGRLGLHSSRIHWREIDRLPLTERGKIDHPALAKTARP